MSQKKESKHNAPNLTTFDTVSASSKKSVPASVSESANPDQSVVSLKRPDEKIAGLSKAVKTQEESKTPSAPNLSLVDSEKTDSKKTDSEKVGSEKMTVIARQAEPEQHQKPGPNERPAAEITNVKTQNLKTQTEKIKDPEKKNTETQNIKTQDAGTQSQSVGSPQQVQAGHQKTKPSPSRPLESASVRLSRPVVTAKGTLPKVPAKATTSAIMSTPPATPITAKTTAEAATPPAATSAPRIVTLSGQDARAKTDVLPAKAPTKTPAKALSKASSKASPKVSRAKVVPTKAPTPSANAVLPQDVQDMLKLTNESYSDAIKAGMTVSKGLENVGVRVSDYIGRSAQSGVDFSRLLLHATTFKDVVSLHVNFTGNVIEDFFKESRTIADIGFSTSAESLNPIHKKAAQTWATLCDVVDFRS